MKRKYLLAFMCLFTLCLFGCKFNKCSKMTEDKIKDEYKYFDITLSINNEKYQLIKTIDGYYYNNIDKNVKIYFDNNTKLYYSIDEINQTKTELGTNYNLNKYVNNIYYVLSYHTSKKSLKNYEIEKTTYLDYEVNLYKNESASLKEEIYISKDLKVCLGFYLKTSEKEINAKIEQINVDNLDISKFKNYQTLKNDLSSIKEQYDNFNITIYLNGTEYQFIKSSNGYYYENKNLDIILYHDFNTNSYYTIDKKSQTKTIVEGEYTMDAYIDNIYFVLSYHLDKSLLLDYNIENTKYLGRDVIKYTQNTSFNETIIIDKETNACLSFEVKDNTSIVSGKVMKLELQDVDLSYLDEYQTLKQATYLNLKSKNEIINSFKNYTIVISQDGNLIKAIKTSDGFLCLVTSDDMTTGVLYDQINNIWYDINESVQEKSLSDKEHTIEEYENTIMSYLTNYLTKLDDKFFMLESQNHLNRDVITYIKNVSINDTLYKQEFIIDKETGACLKQYSSINGKATYSLVEELSFSGDISSYLEYEEVYYAWPKNHEYLDGISEIEYGNLVKGFEDEDGLNLYYENINQSFFKQILKDMKAYGFVKNAQDNSVVDANQNYTFYTYEASNDLGVKIKLEFDGSEKTLLIILDK